MSTVKVPAPTNNGKAIGTKLPASPASGFVLKKCIPKIISRPNRNITTDPAKANDCVSKPNKRKIESPKNRKVTMSTPAKTLVLTGCNMMPLLFILIMAGTLPNTSIMANRVKLIVRISENCKENITRL